jgi:hypothetical protein
MLVEGKQLELNYSYFIEETGLQNYDITVMKVFGGWIVVHCKYIDNDYEWTPRTSVFIPDSKHEATWKLNTGADELRM